MVETALMRKPHARARLDAAREMQPRFRAMAWIADDAPHGEGALAGVAVTVKDILDVAGMPTRWGAPALEGAAPAAADAPAVARLRAAGAAILGKSTTSEYAATPLGFSALTGLTLNPWNPAVTCGGSSAGAGVSVAAGFADLALATDAGCSTRFPAACTGVFGLKPTLGRIPHPGVPEGFANFIHLGLLARDVATIEAALQAAAGPHANDPHSLGHAPFVRDRLRGLRGARVALLLATGNAAPSREVASLTRAAAGRLTALGATLEDAEWREGNPDDTWRVLQSANWAARFAAADDAALAALHPALAEGVRFARGLDALALQRALVRRTALFRAVQALLREFDFLLTPCCAVADIPAEQDPQAPIAIDGTEVGPLRPAALAPLSLFDLTGHPAIAMPAGFGARGGPVGVQLVGRWGAEAHLLAAAAEYEAAHPAPRWEG